MLNYSSSYRESKAIVIGVDRYSDPSFTDLPGAARDACAIADLLGELQIPFSVRYLAGKEATRDAILSALHELRPADPDDRILVYFAGHGFFITDHYGNDTGYLVAFDTKAGMEFTAVSLEEVLQLRHHSSAKHIGFIFDSCFSGQALGLSRGISVAEQKYLSRRAYQVITAGAADQTVSDTSSMTQHLLSTLRQARSDKSRLVTFSSLGIQLKEGLADCLDQSQLPQFGHLEGSQGGEMILLASQSYWSLTPQDENLVAGPPRKFTESAIPTGVYHAEVDLSGRLDALDSSTVVTLSAGLSFSLALEAHEKQRAIQLLNQKYPEWGATRRRAFLYTLLIFQLVRSHIHKLDRIDIDTEYPGYEPIVKASLLRMLRGSGLAISKNEIAFTRLRKNSQASIMASMVYRGEKAPDWTITSEELLAIAQ